MYYLKTEAHFDAVHFLKGYDGKCANMHGHRWRIVAEIKSETLLEGSQTKGMVLDFTDLKRDLQEVCDEFDHIVIYEKGTLMDKTVEALSEEGFTLKEVAFRPTAENLARYIFDKINEKGYDIHRIEVYETPDNCAIYSEE